MSEKRRDNKGRILRANEFQRSDGRYEFRYLDNGIKKSVYSWRLVESDKNPAGKRACKPLRSLESDIATHSDDYNRTESRTVNDYFDDYYIVRKKTRPSTKYTERGRYNKYIRDTIGRKPVAEVTSSDVSEFMGKVMTESGLRIATIKTMCNMLSVIFQRAIKDGIINNNPVDDVKEDMPATTSTKRCALTEQEQKTFVSYIKSNYRYKRWVPLITFLLGTGCRIGEAAALCWGDCDLQGGYISISKTLGYYQLPGDEKAGFHIQSPKTAQAVRRIPMMPFVRDALLEQREINKFVNPTNTRPVDGYSDFVFLTQTGNHIKANDVDIMLGRLVARHNRDESRLAETEGREPCLLPKISAHILRHTFCTRLFENTQNLKVLQKVMGHKSIQTTMDIYVSATEQSVSDSFASISDAMNI